MNIKQIKKLEKLDKLKKDGALSGNEFEIEKKNILTSQPSIFEYIRMIYTEKYCKWNGRATRKEYWSFVVYLLLFILVYFPIASYLGGPIFSGVTNILIFIAGLFLFQIPSFCLCVRRFHDLGISTKTTMIFMVPSFLSQILGLIDPYLNEFYFRINRPIIFLILAIYRVIIFLLVLGLVPGQKYKNTYGESIIKINNKQMEKLEKLNNLRKKRIISEAKFETEKKNLFFKMDNIKRRIIILLGGILTFGSVGCLTNYLIDFAKLKAPECDDELLIEIASNFINKNDYKLVDPSKKSYIYDVNLILAPDKELLHLKDTSERICSGHIAIEQTRPFGSSWDDYKIAAQIINKELEGNEIKYRTYTGRNGLRVMYYIEILEFKNNRTNKESKND